ncbi:hypothetical protein IAD21_04224 [Abditibacteriota bacterium]|nr:hypothetical protein IAD21_04224 [Abditibacteriota bacterium]
MLFYKTRVVVLSTLIYVSATFSQTLVQADPVALPNQPADEKTSDNVAGFVLLARLDKAAYQPVEPITLTTGVKNQRATDAWYHTMLPYEAFKISVITPNGKPATLTDYGKRMLSIDSGSTQSKILRPGDEYSLSCVVNRLYDMSLSGDYKISVESAVPTPEDKLKWLKIVSKTATVTVKP